MLIKQIKPDRKRNGRLIIKAKLVPAEGPKEKGSKYDDNGWHVIHRRRFDGEIKFLETSLSC